MSDQQALPDSQPPSSNRQDTEFVAIKMSEPPTGKSHDSLSGSVDGPSVDHRLLDELSYILKNIILHDSSAAWIRDHQWVVFIPFFNSYLVFRPFYEQGNRYHLIDYLFSAIAFESGCFGLVVAYPDNPIVEIVSIIVGQPFVVTALVLVWAFVPSVRVLPTVMDVDHLARVWPINGQNISTGSQIPTNDSANKPSSGSADSSSTNNDQITILI
ncbi:hypothetical protein RhiJN_20477 [Ceratobasidium sp. AG-Ba]|nr:hypothetical protein RhiJN_20477 [Ceratobasidium sp. AG-Ba]